MSFCSNCGSKLQDGAKFCTVCGTSQSQTTDTGRKSVYDGELRKCPNCGETLESFAAVCPTCGHELRNVGVSKSVNEFENKIRSIEYGRKERTTSGKIDSTDEQIISLITSFPVPNTKEDLFEFVNLAASNIDVSLLDNSIPDDNARKAICKAWKNKLNQVYNKSVMVFDENDVRFQKIKAIYEQTQINIQHQEKKQAKKYQVGLIISMSGSIIGLLLDILGLVVITVATESMDVSSGSLIVLIGDIILIAASIMCGFKGAGIAGAGASVGADIIALLIGTIAPMFSDKSMFRSNTNAIMFAAGIALIISVINLIRAFAKAKRQNKTNEG